MFRTRRRKIAKETLQKAVEKKLDAYLSELATLFQCSIPAVFYALKKMGITPKKTFTYSAKSEEKRTKFVKDLARIPEEKRVYVDESGVDKCLIRERFRALRGTKVEDIKRGRKVQRTNVVAAKIGDLIVAS